MTSRKSYSKLLLIALRNHMWSIALTCIGLFFAMPIYAALNISIINNEFLNGLFKADVLAKVFARNVLGEGNFLLMAATVLLAAIVAINGFSYLFSKEKVDLYHSVPVKRGELFVINYIAGIITFLVPYIVFMIAMLGVGRAYGFLTADGVISTFIMLGLNTLGFLGIYSAIVLAIMLTGNIMVSILASGVLLLYGILVRTLVIFCNDTFFITYSTITDANMLMTNRLSPISAYLDLSDGMSSFLGMYELHAKNIIGFIIYVVIVTVLNYFLYQIRPSEAAGKSITFNKTMPVISVLLLIPISVFGAVCFNSIAENSGKINYGWLVFGALFALVIAHLIVQAIYYRDFKSLFKNLLNPVIAGVISAIILLIYVFDLTGYDTYNPGTNDKLESAAISSYGIQGYQEYYNFDANANEYGDKYYWIDMNEYRLDHMQITDKSLINDFVDAAISDSKYFNDISHNNSNNEDIYKGKAYTTFTVKYNLKNGKTKYREYTIDLLAHMDLYSRLYSSSEYKEGVFEILTIPDDNISDIKFANVVGTVESSLTQEQMLNIVNAYREELLAQDAYDLANSTPIGYIYKDYSFYENGYVNNYKLYKGYIYPSFKKTISLLKEYGVDINKYMTLDNIESITVTNYHYNDGVVAYEEESAEFMIEDKMMYTSTESEYDTVDYYDMDSIKAIYEVAVPAEMSDVDASLKQMAGIDIQVKYKEMPGIYNYTVSYYIPEGKVPAFVANDVNYTGK